VSFNKKPDAPHIARLKTKLMARYGLQDKLDQRMLDHYKLSHPKEMGQPQLDKSQAEFELKSVDAGLVGFIVDQDVFVLNGEETIRVNPFGNQDAEKWASQTAEPWLVAARKAARHNAMVEVKKRQDLRLYGRAWTTTLPAPQLWGGSDFDQNKDESNDDYNARVEKQKRTRFPITQSWVSARGTWPVFDENGDVAETIKIRKVDPEIIKSKFPDAKLPESSQPVEIIEYANHQWFAITIPSNKPEESQELQVWDHHLGRHPDVLFEGEPLPEDPDNPGERWRGAAYHVLSMVETMNDLLSDARTASRMEVTAATVVKQDPEKRAAASAGKPEQLKIKFWDTINIFTSESVERLSVAGLNQAIVTLLSFLKPLLDQTALSRPSLIGSILSGQSSVALNTAAQRAVTELNVSQTSLQDGAAQECQLLFRSVVSLSERFPDIPDAVTVRFADSEHGSREISIEPKPLLDWEPLISVEISQNIPVDEGANVTNYAVATRSGALSKQSARERYLGHEDPLGEEDKVKQEKLDDVLHEGTVQWLQQRLLAGIQQVGAMNPQELIDQSAASTPDIQEVLAQSFDEEGDAETGTLIRGQMNRTRTSRGQRQQTEGRELVG
jgi:hypothetical protein